MLSSYFLFSSHFLSCFNAHLCHISKSSSLWNQISVFSSALRWFGHISVLRSCVLQSRIPDMLPDFVDFIFILLKLASCFSTCLPLCLAFESLLAKHPQCSQSFVAPIPTGLKCAAAIKFKISKYEEKSAWTTFHVNVHLGQNDLANGCILFYLCFTQCPSFIYILQRCIHVVFIYP